MTCSAREATAQDIPRFTRFALSTAAVGHDEWNEYPDL